MKFVILDHHPPDDSNISDARTLERHFDLMFEVGVDSTLKTYALKSLPTVCSKAVVFESLADHRRAYLNYEGEIKHNRGRVIRFAFGEWEGSIGGSVTLKFDSNSSNFRDQKWEVKFDNESKTVLRI